MRRHFKLYPDNHWTWIQVHVWKDQAEMWSKCGLPNPKFEAISMMGTAVNENDDTMTGRIGMVHFYYDRVGSGIVTHELCHVAHGYFRLRRRMRKKFEIKNRNKKRHTDASNVEESFCLLIGNLESQFWSNWFRQRKKSGQHTKYYFDPLPKSAKKVTWKK